jgi:hypothetical protein
METELLKELEARFNQASHTPFQTEPLLSDLGPLGIPIKPNVSCKDSFSGKKYKNGLVN